MSRINSRVTFSGVDIYTAYGADLIEQKPLSGTVSASYAKTAGAAGYKLYHSDIPLKTLEMAFYVEGSSAADVEAKVSGLIAAAASTVISNEATPYEYAAVLSAYTDEDARVDYYHKVTLRFTAIKRKPKATQALTAGANTVTVEGTAKTGPKITFTCSGSHESVNVAGVTVSGITAGHTYIIDAMNGDVTDNGDPYIINTTLYRWPKLDPGANTITIPDDATGTVEYYPLYT